MYRFVCFILLVSLGGLRVETTNTSTTAQASNITVSTPNPATNKDTDISTTDKSTKTSENPFSSSVTVTLKSLTSEKVMQTTPKQDCLIDLKNSKEMLLFLIISLLLLICLLLLVITCLVCKRSRGIRNEELVVMKSSTVRRRNSLNGGPSETDIMLKDCGSVNVGIETALEESQEPEKVGGAAAEVENGVSGKANESGEVAPTHEVEQAGEPDPKKEDLEKAE